MRPPVAAASTSHRVKLYPEHRARRCGSRSKEGLSRAGRYLDQRPRPIAVNAPDQLSILRAREDASQDAAAHLDVVQTPARPAAVDGHLHCRRRRLLVPALRVRRRLTRTPGEASCPLLDDDLGGHRSWATATMAFLSPRRLTSRRYDHGARSGDGAPVSPAVARRSARGTAVSAIDVHDLRGREAVEVGAARRGVRADVLGVDEFAEIQVG
jgi:hypothetical protein